MYRKAEDAVIMLLRKVSARARNAREKLSRRIRCRYDVSKVGTLQGFRNIWMPLACGPQSRHVIR